MEEGLDAEEELARILNQELLLEQARELSQGNTPMANTWRVIVDKMEANIAAERAKPFGLTPAKDK